MPDYRKQAYHIRDVMDGNPIPLTEKKIASISWKHLQTKKITDQEIEKHFKDCGGIALGTGSKVSKFLCFDFDLNKALNGQFYFEAFMERIPEDLRKKLLINSTASGVGKHIWVKTDYIVKTMHLARRLSSMKEIRVKYDRIISDGKTPEQAMNIVLKNPYEVIIETKHRNSYAVLTHPKYKRLQGVHIPELTEDETKLMFETAMLLDCGYTKPEEYNGSIKEYRLRKTFNNETTPEQVMEYILNCGSFKDAGVDYNGNLRALRHGSSAGYSLAVFKDTSVCHVFSPNTIFGEQGSYSPFKVFCICNGYTEAQGIKELIEKQKL